MAKYEVNEAALQRARQLIASKQYVLESDWGSAQPRADTENAFLDKHSRDEYASWYLGLTDGASARVNLVITWPWSQRMIVGLDAPDRGAVTVAGRRYSTLRFPAPRGRRPAWPERRTSRTQRPQPSGLALRLQRHRPAPR